MFDNDRTTYYQSESNDGENRKIEIIFNEPIIFEKLVIMKLVEISDLTKHIRYRRGFH